MDIYGPFSKATKHNQYILVIMDRYRKLTLAILVSKTTSTHKVNLFVYHLLVTYWIPTYHLTDNGMQFTSNLFPTFYTFLVLKNSPFQRTIRNPAGKSSDTTSRSLLAFDITSRNTKRLGHLRTSTDIFI